MNSGVNNVIQSNDIEINLVNIKFPCATGLGISTVAFILPCRSDED